MTVTMEQVQRGVSTFIESEIGRKATGLMKFGIYFLLPSIPTMVSDKIKTFMNQPGFGDFFDPVGNIQLDYLYTRVKDTMCKVGKLELPQYHITLEESDVDLLYNYIKNS